MKKEMELESFKKMMIADNITGLFSTREMRDNNQIAAKLMKNRNGEKNMVIQMNIDYSYLNTNYFHYIEILISVQIAFSLVSLIMLLIVSLL